MRAPTALRQRSQARCRCPVCAGRDYRCGQKLNPAGIVYTVVYVVYMTSSSMVRVTKYRKHTLKEHRVGDDKKDTSFEARLAGVVEGNSGQGEQRLE
jgi:hypothetical protein